VISGGLHERPRGVALNIFPTRGLLNKYLGKFRSFLILAKQARGTPDLRGPDRDNPKKPSPPDHSMGSFGALSSRAKRGISRSHPRVYGAGLRGDSSSLLHPANDVSGFIAYDDCMNNPFEEGEMIKITITETARTELTQVLKNFSATSVRLIRQGFG
jgi:hypothetical protein